LKNPQRQNPNRNRRKKAAKSTKSKKDRPTLFDKLLKSYPKFLLCISWAVTFVTLSFTVFERPALNLSESELLTRRDFQDLSEEDPFASKLDRDTLAKVLHKVDKEGKFTSNHLCFGNDPHHNVWHRTSCRYHNLYYRPQDNQFYYVTEVNETDIFDLDVCLAPLGGRLDEYYRKDTDVHLNPKIITSEQFKVLFPRREEIAVWKKPTLMYVSYNAENFGHFITDELFPLYNLLNAFGALSRDIQLLRRPFELYGNCEYQVKHWGPEQGEICANNYRTLTPLLFNNPVLPLDDAFKEKYKHGIRINQLFAGIGMLSEHCYDKTGHGRYTDKRGNCMYGRSHQMWRYRSLIMKNMGVNPDPHLIVPRVLIWDRAAKDFKPERKLYNLDTLRDRLIARGFEVIYVVDWKDYTILQQLEMISSSMVHVTGPGSGSHISLFLPRHATAIRIHPSELMEWHLFNFLGYLHIEAFQVENQQVPVEKTEKLVVEGIRRYSQFTINALDNLASTKMMD